MRAPRELANWFYNVTWPFASELDGFAIQMTFAPEITKCHYRIVRNHRPRISILFMSAVCSYCALRCSLPPTFKSNSDDNVKLNLCDDKRLCFIRIERWALLIGLCAVIDSARVADPLCVECISLYTVYFHMRRSVFSWSTWHSLSAALCASIGFLYNFKLRKCSTWLNRAT